jgi:glycerate dehydrogenase
VSANPGDLSWDFLKKYGELTVYDRSLTEDTVIERAADADIAIINKTVITRKVAESLPKLKLIALLATGYNVVDCDACKEHGIMVANVPSYSCFAVAQQTMAFILAFANKIAPHSDSVHRGEWVASADFSYFLTAPTELSGKTLGVIGSGNIGQRVARMAGAFEMRVLANTAHPEKYPDADVEFLPLDEMLPQCDFVSLHIPQTPATVKLVNDAFISKMKPGAILVNNARGGELDEDAVARALNEDRLGGLGADVLSTEPPKADNPLLTAKNALITPHIAWAGLETRSRLMGILEQNIAGFLAGKPQKIVNL